MKVADTLRLQKRGSTWYYLRRVPTPLVGIIGRRVIKHSLKTADKAKAKTLRAVYDLQTDALFASAQASALSDSPVGKRNVPLPVLVEYVRAALEEDDSRSAKAFTVDPPRDADELEDMRLDAEMALQIFADPVSGRSEPTVASFAKSILKRAEAAAPEGDDLPQFRDMVRRALVELHRRMVDHRRRPSVHVPLIYSLHRDR